MSSITDRISESSRESEFPEKEIELSQEQICKLIQILREGSDIHELPHEVVQSLDDVVDAQKSSKDAVDAQKKLVDKVDYYLHLGFETHAKDIVELIIDACPEFLSSRRDIDCEGNNLMVCNILGNRLHKMYVYLPLYAEAGSRNGVGGPSGRGGLLTPSCHDNNVEEFDTNVLQKLSCRNRFENDDDAQVVVDVFKALSTTSPPLLEKDDIKTYDLLHLVTLHGENISLARYFIDMDASALHRKWNGLLPINACFYGRPGSVEFFQLLLNSGIQHDSKEDCRMGGLFEKDSDGETPFDLALYFFGKEDAWKCIKHCLAQHSSKIPILHYAIPNVEDPDALSDFFLEFPDSLYIREQGRLPIHVALECGVEWSDGLRACIHANKEALTQEDPVSHMSLFALAASGPNRCELSVLFYILRSHPEQVIHTQQKTTPNVFSECYQKQKRKHDGVFTTPVVDARPNRRNKRSCG